MSVVNLGEELSSKLVRSKMIFGKAATVCQELGLVQDRETRNMSESLMPSGRGFTR